MEGKQYESGMTGIYTPLLFENQLLISLRFTANIAAKSASVTEPQNKKPESPPTFSITLLDRKFPTGVEPIFRKE